MEHSNPMNQRSPRSQRSDKTSQTQSSAPRTARSASSSVSSENSASQQEYASRSKRDLHSRESRYSQNNRYSSATRRSFASQSPSFRSNVRTNTRTVSAGNNVSDSASARRNSSAHNENFNKGLRRSGGGQRRNQTERVATVTAQSHEQSTVPDDSARVSSVKKRGLLQIFHWRKRQQQSSHQVDEANNRVVGTMRGTPAGHRNIQHDDLQQSQYHQHRAEFQDDTNPASIDIQRIAPQPSVQSQLHTMFATMHRKHAATVVNVQDRLQERKAARRKTLIKRFSFLIVGVALIASILWGLLFSPFLALQAENVHISGTNSWVPTSTIEELVQPHIGTSLFLISPSTLSQEIAEKPGVAHVEVQRQYPHGLSIHINAQNPVAMLKIGHENRYSAVDAKGKILSENSAKIQGLPIIQVSNDRDDKAQRAIEEAIAVINALPEQMRTAIVYTEAKTQDSVTMQFNNNRTIIWGDSSQMKLKIAIINKILASPDVLNNKTTIDVSSPTRPILK